jgi:hypothetical protein
MVPNESQKSCEFSATIKFRIDPQLQDLTCMLLEEFKKKHSKPYPFENVIFW